MLILTRRMNEVIVIQGAIKVTVLSVENNSVRIGIEAPKCVSVDREEIHERKKREGTRRLICSQV